MKSNIHHQTPPASPLAIVGVSCRFPKANNLSEFWELLKEGKNAVETIPTNRWDNDLYYSPDKAAPDKSHQKHAAMLEKVDHFDPLFFNISPAEASEMAPSQKLILELAWECLENTSRPYNEIVNRKVGVYIGNIWNDYEHLRKDKNAQITSHSALGQSANIIANRISYFFGFTGPSLVVDTGCSSSLVALHLACQSLWDHSVDECMIGGVNHTLDPELNIFLSKFGGLSAKGTCSTFDAEADGFVRGEGAGIIMVKRLEDAERDGDKIYATIRGSAVNNNGYNSNLPATSTSGQIEMLKEAYERAGIQPNEVHYVETHGTGTKLGDPTESNAIGAFFKKNRSTELRVGSVKTNIGHLEGAAGIAGLIKVILAINNKKLPKNLHFNTPNPDIDFTGLKLKVQDAFTDWPTIEGQPLRAGVNSFGWGGTNAHTILEEYITPNISSAKTEKYNHSNYLLPISARTDKALFENIKNHIHHLESKINGVKQQFINVCASSAIKKPNFEYRTTFSSTSKESMIQKMRDFLDNNDQWNLSTPTSKEDKIVFVFPGQGSQWLGMGKELYQSEPIFKNVIDTCDTAFKKHTDWSLLDQMFAEEHNSRLSEINVIQPMLIAMQIGLAKLWISMGVSPDAVVGHSMGEVGAAYLSGSITLDEAAAVICTRSKLMKTVSGKGGAMAVTELTVEEAEVTIQEYSTLSIAVNNSPKSTVLAGDQKEISQVLELLEAEGKFCRQVKVDVASHSKQMDPLKADLKNALTDLKPSSEKIALYSTVKGAKINGTELTSDYWVNNLRQGVQFASTMQLMAADGHKIFIEVSPHPVLITAINECLDSFETKGITSASTYRSKPEVEELYANHRQLYEKGLNINWKDFYSEVSTEFTFLPSYPFQREPYTFTERVNNKVIKSNSGHPWIGQQIKLANLNSHHYWEAHIHLDEFSFLKDYKINDVIVLPSIAYIEMVLAALKQYSGSDKCELLNIQFKNTITFESAESVKVQLKICEEDRGYASFQFFQEIQGHWALTAEGQYHIKHNLQLYNIPALTKFEGSELEVSKYYDALAKLGLNYGTYFKGINKIMLSENEVEAFVIPSPYTQNEIKKFEYHPTLLDSCLQLIFTHFTQQELDKNKTAYLTSIGCFEVFNEMPTNGNLIVRTFNYPTDQHSPHIHNIMADMLIFNESGQLILKIDRLSGKIITTTDFQQPGNQWYHTVEWSKGSLKKNAESPQQKEFVIITDGNNNNFERLYNKLNDSGHVTHIISSETWDSDSKIITTDLNDCESIHYALKQINLKTVDQILYCIGHEQVETNSNIEVAHSYYLVSLMQALTAQKLNKAPKVTIITNGAQAVENNLLNLRHTAATGLARVISNELPEYEIQHIDFSYLINNNELDLYLDMLQSPLMLEREIAIRNNDIYGARLTKTTPDIFQIQDINFDSAGEYLITGYNGIAFRLVEWMYEKGARKFLLLSRNGKTDDYVSEKIENLSLKGGEFRIIPCDVANYKSLENIFNRHINLKQLKGIIHAAGVISAQPLVSLSKNEYESILNPKVKGGWNLHLLSKKAKLDYFITFSSASSLIGISGQASYVAANAYLDGLAQYRVANGLPAISINWGAINDSGMVANTESLEKYAKAEGFISTSMSEAITALENILYQEPVNIGIFKLNAAQTADYFPRLKKSNYFSPLLQIEKSNDEKQNLLQLLELLPDNDEKKLALENHLKQLTSQIIKTSANKLNVNMRFKSLGIDSIMAVQLRNKLEKDLNLKLSVTNIWEYPTIGEYAGFLLNTIAPNHKSHTSGEPAINHGIIIPQPNKNATHRLICFHDAGGSASLFHDWETMLTPNIELIIVELPGRGKQLSSAPFNDMIKASKVVLKHLFKLLDKPFSFFGHSMGGILAFELTRELRKQKLSMPKQLFVSSVPHLATFEKSYMDPDLDLQQLTKAFPHISEENTPDPELRKVLIKLLRIDLALINNYHYNFEPPFDIPVVGIHGAQDPRISKTQVKNWKNETTVGFQLLERQGGHNYIHHDQNFIINFINSEIGKSSRLMMEKS